MVKLNSTRRYVGHVNGNSSEADWYRRLWRNGRGLYQSFNVFAWMSSPRFLSHDSKRTLVQQYRKVALQYHNY